MNEAKKEQLYLLLEEVREQLQADEELTDHGKDLINSGINNVQSYLS